MKAVVLSQLAQAIGAQQIGAEVEISAISTDSRSIQPGELFIALTGERFDGHEFAEQAQKAGAAALVVERELDLPLPQLIVADTRLALGLIGQFNRRQSGVALVALTGSNGKTTLKEMIAAILRQSSQVLATEGNLNNDIGVPLMLAKLDAQDFAVIEMGANHAGEIDYLTRLVEPNVAVLNNAGRAHLEGFGSLKGVARAKAEILHGLKSSGVFVYNADDAFAPMWQALAGSNKTLSFGFDESADVRANPAYQVTEWSDQGFEQHFYVMTPGGEIEVTLALGGLHNSRNALAAIAAVQPLGIDPIDIAAGLASLKPYKGRLQPKPSAGGWLVIDDSYNANPDSAKAAIDLLVSAPGRRWLVLGELAELGEDDEAMLDEMGRYAKAAGLDRLCTCGDLSARVSRIFGDGACHFNYQAALSGALLAELQPDDVVLVKGSRSSGMEKVVEALVAGGLESC